LELKHFKTKNMGSFAAVAIVTLVLLLIGGNLMTYTFQHKFIFKPIPLDSSHLFQFNSEFEEIFLSTPNSGNLNCLYFPTKSEVSKGLVLYYHGNAGNLDRWGQMSQDFILRGYDFFIMDYRGFGKSTGPMSQSNMYADAIACYHYIQDRFPGKSIIIYGRSLGSAMATYVASKHPADHLVLETPFYSMSDLYFTYYPFLPKLFFFRFPLKNHSYLNTVKYKVTIFQGDNDWIVPYRSASKLQNHLKEEDEFITIPDASHNDCRTFKVYQEKLDEILN
jgi:pimeloyl-ACP methyl ester carboxylesterase